MSKEATQKWTEHPHCSSPLAVESLLVIGGQLEAEKS